MKRKITVIIFFLSLLWGFSWFSGLGQTGKVVKDWGMGEVNITGPATVNINETVKYTATAGPSSLKTPLTFLWYAQGKKESKKVSEGLSSSIRYKWNAPGKRYVSVLVTDADGNTVGYASLDILVIKKSPVSKVSISGPGSGKAGIPQKFTAIVNSDANRPITYKWTAADQEKITKTDEDYVEFSWDAPGAKTVSVKASNQDGSATSSHTIDILSPYGPQVRVNRTQLNFGMVREKGTTSPQSFIVSNSGSGTLEWTLKPDSHWMTTTPNKGTNEGHISVSINTQNLKTGSYQGSIYIDAGNYGSATVSVNLWVKNKGLPPFGSFETPRQNATVRSSIPVTGWVLDDVGVDNVKIYNGSDYIGDAVFIEGARPDVEDSYPYKPANYQAGWGYMMLTNFLPNGGNGSYTIRAVATDVEGHEVTLGEKTIFCDNANVVKPFGAIDTPPQGGTASGSSFINWGWALTPQPNHIPYDGSTINVYVDGVKIGHPNYNIYRKDINDLFPDYVNSNGAVGHFNLDTTGYADGIHTIYWTAADSGGNTDGIGSRYFSICNTDNSSAVQNRNHDFNKNITIPDNTSNQPSLLFSSIEILKDIPVDNSPIYFLSGDNPEAKSAQISSTAVAKIEAPQDTRIEIHLYDPQDSSKLDHPDQNEQSKKFKIPTLPENPIRPAETKDIYSGYTVSGGLLQPLPIGSTMDSDAGIFYWWPGPGFLGKYRLVFFKNELVPNRQGRYVNIIITPKD